VALPLDPSIADKDLSLIIAESDNERILKRLARLQQSTGWLKIKYPPENMQYLRYQWSDFKNS